MTDADVTDIGVQAMILTTKLAAPVLLTALAIGLLSPRRSASPTNCLTRSPGCSADPPSHTPTLGAHSAI